MPRNHTFAVAKRCRYFLARCSRLIFVALATLVAVGFLPLARSRSIARSTLLEVAATMTVCA
jgi:hypothetical protein